MKEEIAEGNISMSNARKMCSVLTEETKEKWFEEGKKTTAELEREVAKENPKAFKKDSVKPVGHESQQRGVRSERTNS